MNIIEKIQTKNEELQLEFWAEEHRYQWGGGELSGVTAYIGEFFPFPKFVVANAIARKETKATGIQVFAEDVIARWDEKRDFGTFVHHRLEYLIMNNWVVDNMVDNYLMQYVKPILEGYEVIGCEVLIGHPPIGLATSIDLLAQKDGKLITINHKTSVLDPNDKSHGYGTGEYAHLPNNPYWKLCLQSEMEAKIMRNEYEIEVDEMYGLAIPTIRAVDGWACFGTPELVKTQNIY